MIVKILVLHNIQVSPAVIDVIERRENCQVKGDEDMEPSTWHEDVVRLSTTPRDPSNIEVTTAIDKL